MRERGEAEDVASVCYVVSIWAGDFDYHIRHDMMMAGWSFSRREGREASFTYPWKASKSLFGVRLRMTTK